METNYVQHAVPQIFHDSFLWTNWNMGCDAKVYYCETGSIPWNALLDPFSFECKLTVTQKIVFSLFKKYNFNNFKQNIIKIKMSIKGSNK